MDGLGRVASAGSPSWAAIANCMSSNADPAGGWMLGRSHVAWMRLYWLFKLLTWSIRPRWYKDRTMLKWIYINHRANSIRNFQKSVTAKDIRILLKNQQADLPQPSMMYWADFWNDLSLPLNVETFLSLCCCELRPLLLNRVNEK